ncbi:hypothetical protein [Thioalkalivibrio sp. ALE20]|uniref:hypothetical protein n=1 Tax=Thioalkalivibrio sp. ALE20 TaxID=545275 RepID=UPI000369DCCA|nr:hypothetical protein [Thioalkalivibrio sp. ALE20]
MIHYRFQSSDLEQLIGRIIFHASRGVPAALAVAGTPMSGARTRIVGERLGEVVRVKGSNRIFYIDRSGMERYVSVAGIGFLCDSEEEANALEVLRVRTATQVAQAMGQIRERLEEELDHLIQANAE